jgi:hypothetical protein
MLTPASTERDLIYCGTDCYATGNSNMSSVLDLSESYFPLKPPFKAMVIPGAGHGLNLVGYPRYSQEASMLTKSQDFTWPTTYQTISDFLAQNAIAP